MTLWGTRVQQLYEVPPLWLMESEGCAAGRGERRETLACVYRCTCVHIARYTYTLTHTQTHKHMCSHIYICTCIYTQTHTATQIDTYILTYMHIYKIYTHAFVYSMHKCACTHLHAYEHSHKHTCRIPILSTLIPGTVTVFPFKICFLDYDYLMMGYKIWYLKCGNENPNFCLCLGSMQFPLLASCWQLGDIGLIHSERPP